jgi:hypothetical protein
MTMTQTERLLDYLQKNKSIDPLAAWSKLGIYRLSDAILRLRKSGHKIRTDFIEVSNMYNEMCRVAKYVLEE